MSKVSCITGAGRGLGLNFICAALAAVQCFGRLDVLLNNAASCQAGLLR